MKAIIDFLIEHWALTLSPVAWLLVRLIPTKKNYDLVAGIVKIIDLIIPNVKKGGGTFRMIVILSLMAGGTITQAQNQFKWIRLTNADSASVSHSDGSIWYNQAYNKFRFRQNGQWVSLGDDLAASNGIAIESNVVKLGTPVFSDAVITGTRYVTIGDGTATLSTLRFDTNTSFSGATIQIVGHAGTIGITNGTDVIAFTGNATMNNRRITLTDGKTPGNRTGLQYGGDYSSDLISQPRSMPDVGMMLGAKTYTDGATQTMNPNGTTSGLNVGSQAGDPSSLTNGDVWYNSTSGNLRARIGGTSVSLGSGNISGTITAGRVTYGTGANTIGDEAAFTYNAASNLLTTDNAQVNTSLVVNSAASAVNVSANAISFGSNGGSVNVLASAGNGNSITIGAATGAGSGNNGGDVRLSPGSSGGGAGVNGFVKLLGPVSQFANGTTDAWFGRTALTGGTATINNVRITANTNIFLTIQIPGGTVGSVYISARSVGTSFTITSTSGTDTSTVAWWLVENQN
jgi:hypothetical protein